MTTTQRPDDDGKNGRGDEPPGHEQRPEVRRRQEGVIPMEDEATGYLPVVDGEDSYDVLRMPHERDESVDPAPPPRGKRPRTPD